MREWLKKHRGLAAGGGLLFAGLAWASPWDIDLIDSVNLKAYEWEMMRPIPPGSVPRPSGGIPRAGALGAYQNDPIPQHDRATEADSLANPYTSDDASLANGKRLFGVSCAPCHGQEGTGHGPVVQNDPEKGVKRFPVPAPILSGPGAVSPARSDGYIYLTVRNGGIATGENKSLMPRYGLSLTDQERWAIVAYIRTLDGAQYVPPAQTAVPGGNP